MIPSSSTTHRKSLPRSCLEDVPDALPSPRRALDVPPRANLLGDLLAFGLRDGPLGRLLKLLDRARVLTKILLAADEDDGQVLAEVKNLGDPLREARRVSAKSS